MHGRGPWNINSFWPSDVIQCHKSWLTLDQVCIIYLRPDKSLPWFIVLLVNHRPSYQQRMKSCMNLNFVYLCCINILICVLYLLACYIYLYMMLCQFCIWSYAYFWKKKRNKNKKKHQVAWQASGGNELNISWTSYYQVYGILYQ